MGEDEFAQLRAALRVPTVATWCAADLVPSNDPTYVGRPGTVAARGANFALQNSDFLLAIGVRLDFAITGYAPQNLAREAYKVAVDIDAAELGKLHPYIQQPICTDAKAFLRELLRQKDSIHLASHTAWDARCADWKTRYPVVTDDHRKQKGRVSIFHLAEVIGAEVSADDELGGWKLGLGDRDLSARLPDAALAAPVSYCRARRDGLCAFPWQSRSAIANPGQAKSSP